MSTYKKLLQIQSEIDVPKSQYNAFGKYYYRSCEDILKAVKPLLEKYDCTLTVSDEIQQIGDRYYVKATAQIVDCESGEKQEVSAYARESQEKKGMDTSQITGATSSYARKYALNGLLCLDDVKDADTHKPPNQQSKSHTIYELIEKTGTDKSKFLSYLSQTYGVEAPEELTEQQADKVISQLKAKLNKEAS